MRVDKAKNIAKVAKTLLENPLQTEREIAEQAGISNGTAHNIKGELEQIGAKDDRIVGLTDDDFDCIKLGVNEIKKRLGDAEELAKMRTVEISQVIKENTARYSLFRGNATDNQGGLKNGVKNLSDDELLKMLG